MNHSNQIREYQITKNGIHLLDVYRSVGGVLVGSARRHAQAAQQRKKRAAVNDKKSGTKGSPAVVARLNGKPRGKSR